MRRRWDAVGLLTYHSRRLTGWTAVPGDTTTFTAWDSSGRPTTGSISNSTTISNVYDDAARTETTTSNPGNTVSTQTFDAHGNLDHRRINSISNCVSLSTITAAPSRLAAALGFFTA